MEDDVYKDMHIPKGSLVFGNIWYEMLLIIYFGVPWLAAFFFYSFNYPLISHTLHTGRWCATKRYIRMLLPSVLNVSWYQLRLRWNARWIQKILCLGLAEGEFLALVWLIEIGRFRTYVHTPIFHCSERGCWIGSIFNLFFVDRLTSFIHYSLLDYAREITSSILRPGRSSYRCFPHWISPKLSMTLGTLLNQRWTIITLSSGM